MHGWRILIFPGRIFGIVLSGYSLHHHAQGIVRFCPPTLEQEGEGEGSRMWTYTRGPQNWPWCTEISHPEQECEIICWKWLTSIAFQRRGGGLLFSLLTRLQSLEEQPVSWHSGHTESLPSNKLKYRLYGWWIPICQVNAVRSNPSQQGCLLGTCLVREC